MAPASTSAPEGVVCLRFLERGRIRELQGTAAMSELRRALNRRGGRLWIDISAGGPALKSQVARAIGLHPLLEEDIVERDQRAKLESTDGMIHLVLFSLGMDDGEIHERELDFVLGPRFLLTSHSQWWNPMATRHLRAGAGPVLAEGLDHLLWALCDDTIDRYFPLLDQLGDEIDELEDRVVSHVDRALLERLFELKRELIRIRRTVSPEREIFNVLSSRDENLVSAKERLYFRDAYDHLIRVTDELDTYRDLASAALETYLSTVNNNLSFIMKRLTGVTVVVAGLGAVGGFFGMSEAGTAFNLRESAGFWIVIVASLIGAAVVTAILRRIDWI